MTRNLVCLAAGLALLALAACVSDNPSPVDSNAPVGVVELGPRLTIPDTLFDFGYVPQGALVGHRFWLISTGSDTLTIKRIVPG